MQKKIILFIGSLMPLFSGLLVVRAKPAPIDLNEYLIRYLLFITLFTFWTTAKTLAPYIVVRANKIVKGVTITFGAILLLSCFYLFRLHFEKIEYEIALSCIGLSALSIRFYMVQRIRTWILLEILYYFGISFLSFQMVHFSFDWQTMIFACGVSCVTTALLISGDKNLELMKPYGKHFSILLVLTPLTIGGLVINNDLNILHGFIFLLIPLASKLRLLGNEIEFNQHLFRKTTVFWLSFIVILSTVAILE